ncbi:RICIN domain-containing protein [Streptomyces sp. NPDC052396]|uniref:RICIN domain-containing protein n=1 Tax=Streptomyces sp. NPDC052396 TaxID=3365689 RepID=UPI0037D1749F
MPDQASWRRFRVFPAVFAVCLLAVNGGAAHAAGSSSPAQPPLADGKWHVLANAGNSNLVLQREGGCAGAVSGYAIVAPAGDGSQYWMFKDNQDGTVTISDGCTANTPRTLSDPNYVNSNIAGTNPLQVGGPVYMQTSDTNPSTQKWTVSQVGTDSQNRMLVTITSNLTGSVLDICNNVVVVDPSNNSASQQWTVLS